MIDLSNNNAYSWNPLAYNFAKAYSAGQRRVYFKRSEGATYVDKRTPALAARAAKAGFKVGWYHFANSWWQHPETQAKRFTSLLKGQPFDCIPCLDMEEGAPSLAKGKWALAFARQVEVETGEKCMIYGSTYYLKVCFGNLPTAVRCPLWIAAVSRTGGYLAYEHVTIPHPWSDRQVAFHQNDWHASVPGIPGRIDRSKPIHPKLADVKDLVAPFGV